MTTENLIVDTTCLNHFSLADRLDVLGDLLGSGRASTTDVVREELREGAKQFPVLREALNLEWLTVETLDSLERLKRFVVWTQRVAGGQHNLGEASVLSIAEELGAVAILDDQDATKVGRRHGIEVHGTLWLLVNACRACKITTVGAGNLVDSLRATGMRLPCTGSQLAAYAQDHGMSLGSTA